jgi:hypothetical protein
MTSETFALVLSALALIVAWFFRTPAQQSEELRERVARLEGELSALSTNYAGIHGRHDQALTTLTTAIDRLTTRLDAYMGSNGHANGRR